jgi:hypothetical protein
VHEQVHVIGLAVELAKFRAEVRADVTHDLLAAGQDLPGERAAPVLRREDQMGMEAVDNGPSPANVGVSLPAWCHRRALFWVLELEGFRRVAESAHDRHGGWRMKITNVRERGHGELMVPPVLRWG